ncbi:hypothetical protein JCM3766R1_006650 [Sporobolomyces carnicolor]
MGKSTLKGAKKATKYRAREADKEKAFDPKQSRLKQRMETYEDTMGGDEDQFHLNRDKMLLDEDGYAQNGDDDSLDEPDEIYGLNLPDRDSSDDDEEVEDDDEHAAEEEEQPKKRQVRERKEKKPIYDPKSGRFGHTYDPKQDQVFDSSSGSEASDDEDGDTAAPAKDQLESTVSSDDEGDRKKNGSDSDSDDEDRWAAGHYHVSRRAPGEADSEDEEALELEAEEARRLQKKALEKLRGEDYGLADSDDDAFDSEKGKLEERLDLDEAAAGETKDEEEGKVDTQALNEQESIAHLLKYSPETLALVDDFVRTASKIKDVESDLENIRKVGDGQGCEHPGLAIMELEHQALSTYLPTLAFYFSLLLSPTPHPQALLTKVLNRISSLRQSLATMEELDLTTATYGDDEEGSDEEADEEVDDGKMLASEMFDFHNSLKEDDDEDDDDEEDDEDSEEGEEITESMLEGLDDDELEEIMQDVSPEDGAEGLMKKVRQRQREKGMDVPDSEDDDDEEMSEGEGSEDEGDDFEEEEEEVAAPPSKKVKKSTAPVIPTLAPLSSSSRPKTAKASARTASATSDYLDPSALSHGDLADKASTRHSLRFHVSQVAQKAARRERLATAIGGDDDVPRRSKEQARREVLKKQQHGAKDAASAEGLDGGDWDDEDRKAAKAVRGAVGGDNDDGGNDDEDYYDLVKMEKDEGRKAKKAKYDGDRAAEKAEIEALSASMADGPRGATRQILANKGLTPRRKKENRNARVKKRLRYDKAQKKLSSMKATYKGGEARTGYEGEGSGIARRTVKSRQLG